MERIRAKNLIKNLGDFIMVYKSICKDPNIGGSAALLLGFLIDKEMKKDTSFIVI